MDITTEQMDRCIIAVKDRVRDYGENCEYYEREDDALCPEGMGRDLSVAYEILKAVADKKEITIF